MAVGAAWMILARFAVRAIGTVSTIILARLLLPEDFGVIAISTAAIGILNVISAMGVDVVLIRDQQADRAKYDTAWTLQILRGMAIAVIVLACAESAGQFFGDPRIESVLRWLALVAVLSGFQNIGIVNFRQALPI